MNRYLYAVAFSFSVIGFSSCQKTNVPNDERNIEGTWLITGIRSDRPYDFNGDGYTETDIYNTYSSCGKDITVLFKSGGYGQMRQGCNANWQNINWQHYSNTLTINLPDDQLNLQLQQFDEYTIRGTDQVSINGNYFNISYTLKRR